MLFRSSGVCTGGNPVVCTASDQCHVAGTCDPKTGMCSNPVKKNGSPCDDGNLCTTKDTCQGGACTGQPVKCDDGNPCTTDSCNPATGQCVFTALNCDDGNPCTVDSCKSGSCVHKLVKGCTPP